MAAKAMTPLIHLNSLSAPLHSSLPLLRLPHSSSSLKLRFSKFSAIQKSKEEVGNKGNDDYSGFPKEIYDEEWQARQREKTKEWHAYRQKEEEEEDRRTTEYRDIGMRLKGYPEEEVRNAKKFVSSLIRSAEEVEEKIEEAAELGELTELVLMVIWNRLDLARHDHQSRIGLPPEDDDVLLRVDFVREVDALLQEVRAEQENVQSPKELDPESVAARLKQQEKQRTIHQIIALLELAVTLEW